MAPSLSRGTPVVYFLRLRSGVSYIGTSTDIEQRLDDHASGQACGTTALNRPVALLGVEVCSTFTEARQREAQLKRWSRAKRKRSFPVITSNYGSLVGHANDLAGSVSKMQPLNQSSGFVSTPAANPRVINFWQAQESALTVQSYSRQHSVSRIFFGHVAPAPPLLSSLARRPRPSMMCFQSPRHPLFDFPLK